MRFGYIGLGNMGGALARRMLLQHELVVYDLSADLRTAFAAEGAVAVDSVSAVGAACDVVFLCLPTSAQVREVVLGEGGLGRAMASGVICDQTTGDPVVTREIADAMPADLQFIDGPVSGGPAGAAAGTIAIMLGGADNAAGQVMPALEAVSPNIWRTGAVGSGHVMKLANNMLNAVSRLATFEAFALALKNGIDANVCAEILDKSSGHNYATMVTLPKYIIPGNLNQGFSLGLMHKDIRTATQLGVATGVPLTLANVARESYHAAENEHGAGCDVNTVIRLLERAAAIKLAGTG